MQHSARMMKISTRFRTETNEDARQREAETDMRFVRFQSEENQRHNSILLRPLIKFGKVDGPIKYNKCIGEVIKQGATNRELLFKNISSPFRTRISNRKSVINASQKQNIKTILRGSINRSSSKSGKQIRRKEKWIKQSFTKVIKDLRNRQKVMTDKQKENNKNKVESYGSTIKGDKHHVNQDSIAFSECIYVVCDGHGTNGKQISEFVAQTSHRFFLEAYTEKKIDTHHIRNILKKTELELDISGIDISFSGCTFIGIIVYENSIFSICVGDSKAIMCHGITTSELCTLHKPDHPVERARIENSGGCIHPFEIGKDRYSGPNRIYAPGKNSWGPGLALSRAFGDKAARKYGLISEPQIRNIRITYQLDFIVLGSDGLFDYMKDSEISFFVRKKLKEQHKTRDSIALHLVEEAKRIASIESDDISCIIILL